MDLYEKSCKGDAKFACNNLAKINEAFQKYRKKSNLEKRLKQLQPIHKPLPPIHKNEHSHDFG